MRSDGLSTPSPTQSPYLPGSEDRVAAVPAVGSRLDADGGVGYLIVLATRDGVDGETTEIEAVCGPGAPGVEERSFTGHEVSFEVLAGRLTIGIEGRPHHVGAGAALGVEAGTPHRIWVEPGHAPARFVWRLRPVVAGAHPDFDLGRPAWQAAENTNHNA